MFNVNNTYIMTESWQKYTFPTSILFSLLLYSLSTKEKSSEDDFALKAFYYESGSNGANRVLTIHVQPFFMYRVYMTIESIQTEDHYLSHKIVHVFPESSLCTLCSLAKILCI